MGGVKIEGLLKIVIKIQLRLNLLYYRVLYNTVKTNLKFCVPFLEWDAAYGFSAPYHGKGSQNSNITCRG